MSFYLFLNIHSSKQACTWHKPAPGFVNFELCICDENFVTQKTGGWEKDAAGINKFSIH
jgi:hypothetical protein